MDDKQMLKIISFIETIRERFDNEQLTALSIKKAGIKEDNEYLQFWLNKNKDEYELIGNDIRRTTREDRIKNIEIKISQLKTELKQNKQKIKYLQIRDETIYEEIHELIETYAKLKGDDLIE